MAAAYNAKKPVVPVPQSSATAVKSDTNRPIPGELTSLTPDSTENTVSMIFGAVVVGIVLLLAISFWRDWRRNQSTAAETTPTPTTEVVEVQELPVQGTVELEASENGQMVPKNLPAKYTVKAGDSTWQIAQAFYGSGFNYVDIEQANKLTPDQDLNVGMELTIPKTAVRSAGSARAAESYTEQPGKAPVKTGASKGDTAAEEAALKN